MSNFISISDYSATIHDEILNSLIRNDEAIVEICENRTIELMKSYLSGRYDTKAIFAARGDERNQLILMFAMNITVYYIFTIHNPMKIATIRKEQFDQAKQWLEAVARQEITIPEAPLLPEAERSSTFLVSSQTKRNNYM